MASTQVAPSTDGAFLAVCRVLLRFCCNDGATPALKTQVPSASSKRPPPRYVCYHDVDETLIQKQLEVCACVHVCVAVRKLSALLVSNCMRYRLTYAQFRKIRRKSRVKSGNSLDSLGEVNENRSRWLRIAACSYMQAYVRLVRAANGTDRMPAYLRDDWIPPTSKEFDERVMNLAVRFPGIRLGDLGSELRIYRGHAGYAAAALQQRPKRSA